MNILVIYGSLSEKSINKALATAAVGLAPEGMTIELAGVADFPLFNQDLEINSYPEIAVRYKKMVRAADGVIFALPEYNRGIPGPLKNAIDWLSRPSGQHPWGAKPIGVIGASSGPRGTIVSQYDLKRIFNYFGAHVMGQPEFYVDNSDKKVDDGVLKDEKTKDYLKRYLGAFESHIKKFT